ncbi:response regulator transcription factor [Solihabitans fulvus]|uniref:Response regulator transcription factor n=1 Tax=Solihabitans fulvus TaxID=1892852 RepID=A0A5B2WAT3_9PSEU|nr:response regulator [Solihabitans fulvus]KAA2247309.1 response regulator transcription factor [Solihabitans fulvus]
MDALRILIVEDEGVSVEAAINALRTAASAAIDVVSGPFEAIEKMKAESYDVALVDMLFRTESDEFETRRRLGRIGLDGGQLHQSGLAVLHAIAKLGLPTRPVIWSGGAPNRRIHMIFAHEVMGCRVMCAKEASGDLPRAVAAALQGSEYMHPVLGMYLTPDYARPLKETLLASPARLRIWRAMASGQHQHKAIAKSAGVKPSTIRKSMDDLRSKLLEFDPGYPANGSPSTELIRYVAQNWEFFLDDTVRAMFP